MIWTYLFFLGLVAGGILIAFFPSLAMLIRMSVAMVKEWPMVVMPV